MTATANLSDRAEAVRRKTLETLKLLAEKDKAFGLPEPPPGLEQHCRKLEENTYQVLVVGEAKRGKSTFVNALIGRDILPTDVDIATSQVFRVCPAEREAYRLRFEDDSQQAITAADLPRYGSQVVADVQGVPRLDQLIRWIEVDVPARFLPGNVRLLDTPGLGALYAAHAQITHRFVPHADAVIFVLDSQAPVGEPEAQFVEKLLGVTRSIFFIQTKIDQFRREAWQEIQKRNQDILRERFKDRLAEPRVWPISSTNLRKAAQTGDDDYLMVSRHRELAAALQDFLFRVAGWGRSVEAILLAEHLHSQSRQVLAARLDALAEESKGKRAESQQLAAERRRRFEAEWGERGQRRRELLEGIQKACALARQEFRQALQPGGRLEAVHRDKIESLQSMEEAKRYGEVLSGQVVDAAAGKWRDVCVQLQGRCTELVGPFLSEAELVPAAAGGESPSARSGRPMELNNDLWGKVKGARMDMMQAAGTVGLAGGLLSFVIATSWWFPPVAISAVAVAGIWGLVRGWRAASANQLKAARQELQRHLANTLQEVRRHFFDVDLSASRFSRVDEYFNLLEQSLTQHIAKVASQKLAEAQAETARLAEESQLDGQARRVKAEQLRQQLAEWDDIGRSIRETQVLLGELERGPSPPPAPPA
jgi:GTP-binding protein EngB required for normal cell division